MSTRLYALLGNPVSHSLSPAMYAAAFGALGLDAEYHAFDVRPEDLARRLTELHDAGYEGLNLTSPLKTIGAELAENTTSLLKVPINTLARTPTGWTGWNTDGSGLSDALEEDLDINLKGANVILLGAGGAARGAAFECLWRGAKTLSIGARSSVAIISLLNDLKTSNLTTHCNGFLLDDLPSVWPSNAIVINATSCGMKADDPSPINLNRLPSDIRVFDMIYAHDTALLRQARALGLKCCDGRSMLLYQGVHALGTWIGYWPPVHVIDAMRAAIRAE